LWEKEAVQNCWDVVSQHLIPYWNFSINDSHVFAAAMGKCQPWPLPFCEAPCSGTQRSPVNPRRQRCRKRETSNCGPRRQSAPLPTKDDWTADLHRQLTEICRQWCSNDPQREREAQNLVALKCTSIANFWMVSRVAFFPHRCDTFGHSFCDFQNVYVSICFYFEQSCWFIFLGVLHWFPWFPFGFDIIFCLAQSSQQTDRVYEISIYI
jgi:hypothetical protein